MKAHLAKVSLALLSAAFLLGCQEQGSEPVGPEGLAPQFAKDKACPDSGHPSCKPAEDDDKTVTVTLSGGMETSDGGLTGVKVFSDNNKKFSMNTGGPGTGGTIMTHFPAFVKADCLVENDTDTDEDKAVVALLKSQLDGASINVSDPSFSLFWVQVDRTTEEPDRGNDLQVTYELAGVGPVILGWAHRDRAAVSEDPGETFEFRGGQIRVGEDEGRSKDRIRILCPSKLVTVTVTR